MTNPLSRREFLEISACASAMTGALPTGDASVGAHAASAGDAPTDQSAGSSSDQWFTGPMAGRSVARANQGMVATSQPLASQVGLEILKRGGNAVDAAIAVAAMLNVTEPNMTGIGGDCFAMIYTAKSKKLDALNASGRCPKALTLDHFTAKKITQMPLTGMETITVPGAFDGWLTVLEKYGTMKFADLMAPAISYAENGFPVMEKISADWEPEVGKLKQDPAAAATYLVDGGAAKPGTIFTQKNLAKTFRTLVKGGRDAYYRGEIARAIVDYCQKHGGFLGMEDFAAQKSNWVEPISTTYRGYTLHELPPNNQGLTALLILNILEGLDLKGMRNDPVLYYHTLIEATKIAFADRNRYIADPALAKLPVKELIQRKPSTRRSMATSTWAATPPTSPSSTRIATRCRSSTACSTRLDQESSPGRRGSCCRIAAAASRSTRIIPTSSSPASGRSTR
jgi:gamma-glutamyltranspeptidase/glutathione hydrolase